MALENIHLGKKSPPPAKTKNLLNEFEKMSE